MSQQSALDPSAGGGGNGEEPPPLETVDLRTVGQVLPHLAENVPLRRAPEADVQLSRPAGSGNMLSTNEDATAARRKNTSFKITNILPSRPPSNDPDESGEDDPDDSRTEDISDNMDEVNGGLVVAAGGGNVVTGRRPSIQNLGRLGSVQGEVTATMYPISELGFVDGITGMTTPGQGPVHGPKDRFKVVKIETSAPQRRGRWTCIEYADKQTSTTATSATTTSTTTSTAPASEISTVVQPQQSVSVSDSHTVESEVYLQQQHNGQQQQQQQLASPTVPQAAIGTQQPPKFPPSLHEDPAAIADHQQQHQQHIQQQQQQQMQQQHGVENNFTTSVSSSLPAAQGATTTYSTSPVPFAAAAPAQPPMASAAGHHQTPPPVAIFTSSAPAMSVQPTVSMAQPVSSMPQVLPPQSVQAEGSSVATAIRSQRSVPSNLQGFEGYPGVSSSGGGQVVPGVQSPSTQLPVNPHHTYSGVPSSAQLTHPAISQQAYVTQQQQQQSPMQQQQPQQFQHQPQQQQQQQQQISQYQNISMPPQQQQQQYQQATTSQSQQQPQQQLLSHQQQQPSSMPMMSQQQQQHQNQQQALMSAQQPAIMQPVVNSSIANSMAMPAMASGGDAIYMPAGSSAASVAPPPMISASRHVSMVQPMPPPQAFLAVSSPQVLPPSNSAVNSIPPSRDPIAGGGGGGLTPNLNAGSVSSGGNVQLMRDNAVAPIPMTFKDSQPIAGDLLVERLEEISTQRDLIDDPESASGSSQGAIDNRIEQAMDLVKSHLMNAVRSEVEELKEKIVKLEEIISQLQSENEFLRANVNRDVLLQLQQQHPALGSPPGHQAALPPMAQPQQQ